MDDSLTEAALEYHRQYPPGKIAVTPTKSLVNQRDLSLAYSPGVAAACRLIVEQPGEARHMTARGNLVAGITNGTAGLGFCNIGPPGREPGVEGETPPFKKIARKQPFPFPIAEKDP